MMFSDALFCLANSIIPSVKYLQKNKQLIIKIVADEYAMYQLIIST